jgi:Ca2+-transporting ATPase
MWASEPVPFDPMEKRYTRGIRKQQQMTRRQFSMIHEYPLDGNRP